MADILRLQNQPTEAPTVGEEKRSVHSVMQCFNSGVSIFACAAF